MTVPGASTVDDFARLDDEGRFDLIRGEIFKSPFHGWRAGSTSSSICLVLANYIEKCQIDAVCVVASGFILERHPDTVLTPDIACVMSDKLPGFDHPGAFPECAPDLVVEMLSVDEEFSFVFEKVHTYLDAGTRMIWQVEPLAERMTVCTNNYHCRLLTGGGEFDGGDILPDFRMPVSDIFR